MDRIQKAGFVPVTIYLRDSVLPEIPVIQGDTGRGYAATFVGSDGELMTAGAGYTAEIYGANPEDGDEKAYKLSGVSEGDIWYLEIPAEAVSKTGQVYTQIALSLGSEKVIQTSVARNRVSASITNGGVFGHSTAVDFETVERLAEEVRKSLEEVQSTAEKAGKAATTAEETAKEAKTTITEIKAQSEELKQIKTDSEETLSSLKSSDTAYTEKLARVDRDTADFEAAESARKKAEEGRVSAENARAGQEKSRSDAEKDRAFMESERRKAENVRKQAEAARSTAEDTRAKQESARVSEEAKRVQAEKGRVAAEMKRVTETGEAVGRVNDALDRLGDQPVGRLAEQIAALETGKADKAHQHAMTDVTGLSEALAEAGKVKTVNGKSPDGSGNIMIPSPDLSPYATKTEVAGKADKSHSHAMSDVTGLQDALQNAGKVKTVNGKTPDSAGDITIPAPDLSPYATKDELDKKADKGHTHTIDQVKELNGILNDKLDLELAKRYFPTRNEIAETYQTKADSRGFIQSNRIMAITATSQSEYDARYHSNKSLYFVYDDD